jgi:hypothetical protein
LISVKLAGLASEGDGKQVRAPQRSDVESMNE